MLNIAIRADGSPEMGMGHIMRCLSLAREFKKAGHFLCFISRYKEGIDKIESEGFEVFEIISNKSDDFFELQSVILEKNIQVLIIDSYNVTENYFLRLKPYVKKLCYIDDVNKFVYPVDLLINGNITGGYIDYKKHNEKEIFLLGPKYNLIREEFKDLPHRKTKHKISQILITTGGGDQHNLSLVLLNAILSDINIRKVNINLIIGNAFDNKAELIDIAKKNSNVILYENVKYMSKVMIQSDVAISAGGSTLYELCACGTPTMAVVVADNQEFIVSKMDELGYVKSLGWHNEIEYHTLTDIVGKFINNYKLREEMSKKGQMLVDGNGACRIVKEIERMLL